MKTIAEGGTLPPPSFVRWLGMDTPPQYNHGVYLVLDAPHAHLIQEVLMESGLAGHTTAEVRAVLSMDPEEE